jgi:GNAT superfamily N-acetyltransferase
MPRRPPRRPGSTNPPPREPIVAFRDQATAWLASKDIDQWQEPWPTPDLMLEGMLANIEAGETFIVWDDNHTPAATITINRWAKPELWTEEEAAEPALYAYKVTVDRAYGGQGLGAELLAWAGSRAGDEGADWLRVDVWTTNEHLQHYYLKQGYHLRPHRGPAPLPLGSAVPAASPAHPNAPPAGGPEPNRLRTCTNLGAVGGDSAR